MTKKFVVHRTYPLEFTEPEYSDLVVEVRAMSLGEADHAWFDLSPEPGVDDNDTFRAKQAELHEMFVDHLVAWNLTEEDETPVPPTLDGLRGLEPSFAGMIVGVWKAGRRQISGPLGGSSTSGEPPTLSAEVESTLAGIPSESLAS